MPSFFAEKVYNLCRQIPCGSVSTYKAIAQALGTKAYRAIGQALRRNPYAPAVPCHRVVSSKGNLWGFKGAKTAKALNEKKALLLNEGVAIKGAKVLNFKDILFKDFIKGNK